MAFSDFGKTIKKKLVDIDKNQEWLIGQVRAQTGGYFDSSYLYKIMSGMHENTKAARAIRNILDIQDCNQSNTQSVQYDGRNEFL